MKKYAAMLTAFVIIAAIATVALMLTGRFDWVESISVGVSASLGGILGPVVAAWVQKMWRGNRA